MTNRPKQEKPQGVLRAEWALWAWTLWACLSGVHETWSQIPDIEQAMGDQLQGMISIEPNNLLAVAIGGYAGLALVSVWFIYKIGQGKNWARNSALWSFIIQVGILLIPPYNPLPQYLSDVPDLGLQIYALGQLYNNQSCNWFERKSMPT